MTYTPAAATAAIIIAAFACNVLTGCESLSPTTSGRVVVQNENTRVEVAFNDYDRHHIHKYYKHHHKGLPPGLAKKRQLPPGASEAAHAPGHAAVRAGEAASAP